jgi:hypothetical protein
MLINLSYDINDIEYFLEQSDKTVSEVFDIIGICKPREGAKVSYARVQDTNSKVELKSIREYSQEVEQLSLTIFCDGSTIREIKVSELRLFWFTSIALKHDSFHWGQAFFYFKNLLIEYPEIFEGKELTVVIPRNKRKYLNQEFSRYFKRQGYSIRFKSRPEKDFSVLSWLKVAMSLILNVVKLKISLKTKGRFATVSPHIEKQFVKTEIENSTTKKLYNYSSEWQSSYEIPILLGWQQLTSYPWKKEDALVIKSLPSFGQILSMLTAVFYKVLTIPSLSNQEINFIDGKFTFKLIQKDVLTTLYDVKKFFSAIWLENYCHRLKKPTKFFFEDEFYDSGKLISSSVKNAGNKLITTIGFQHGLITKDHTVYQITDGMINNLSSEEDGLPIPQQFWVWGSEFKKRFLKINTLPDSYVKVVGNLNYIHHYSKYTVSTNKISSKRTLLWCTTTKSHTLNEFRVMEQGLQEYTDNIQLIVRLHPANHTEPSFVDDLFKTIPNLRYKFSENKSIWKDFEESDVVIATMLSTVFVDAWVAQKVVFKVITPLAFHDFKDLDGVLNIYNALIFREELKNIVDNNTRKDINANSRSGSSVTDYFQLEEAIFKQFILE